MACFGLQMNRIENIFATIEGDFLINVFLLAAPMISVASNIRYPLDHKSGVECLPDGCLISLISENRRLLAEKDKLIGTLQHLLKQQDSSSTIRPWTQHGCH